MKSELEVALKMKAKGYRHVIQVTALKNKVRENFGDPIFLKTAQEAGPLLREIDNNKFTDIKDSLYSVKARIAWSDSIEKYIDKFCVHEDKDGKGSFAAGYPARCATCGLIF